MAEETAEAAANGGAKPERKPRDEGPPIEELFDLTKPIPKVSFLVVVDAIKQPSLVHSTGC